MTKQDLIRKIAELESPYGLLAGICRGPQSTLSAWPTGMPYVGGDPETALLQREDVNEAIDLLEQLCCELFAVSQQKQHP